MTPLIYLFQAAGFVVRKRFANEDLHSLGELRPPTVAAIDRRLHRGAKQLGGSDDPRLVPLLAAMDQQIPWVKQWHNDTDNEYGYALGDFFEDFIATEARNLVLTLEDVRAWAPPEKAKSGRRASSK